MKKIKSVWILLLCVPFITHAKQQEIELAIGAGWRQDYSSQQIFESDFSASSPAYQQNITLAPLWGPTANLAFTSHQFRIEGNVQYAPFGHGTEWIYDYERSGAPAAQQAVFHVSPSGYALDASSTVSYALPFSQSLQFLPIGGYVYDKLKMNRGDVSPTTFIFPNAAASSPTFSDEVDSVWGPFLGADVAVQWPKPFSVQAGYEYQFLFYQSTYKNHLHITQSNLFDQNVLVSRFIKASHAYAHQAHAKLTWEVTPLWHLALLGEATFRYVNPTKCAFTNINIQQTLPTVSNPNLSAYNTGKIYWSTLNLNLLVSVYF